MVKMYSIYLGGIDIERVCQRYMTIYTIWALLWVRGELPGNKVRLIVLGQGLFNVLPLQNINTKFVGRERERKINPEI